jgi:hypothetical protein
LYPFSSIFIGIPKLSIAHLLKGVANMASASNPWAWDPARREYYLYDQIEKCYIYHGGRKVDHQGRTISENASSASSSGSFLAHGIPATTTGHWQMNTANYGGLGPALVSDAYPTKPSSSVDSPTEHSSALQQVQAAAVSTTMENQKKLSDSRQIPSRWLHSTVQRHPIASDNAQVQLTASSKPASGSVTDSYYGRTMDTPFDEHRLSNAQVLSQLRERCYNDANAEENDRFEQRSKKFFVQGRV